jgi:hypothetical protein
MFWRRNVQLPVARMVNGTENKEGCKEKHARVRYQNGGPTVE